ncbi:MAG: PAS domain S-box protein, partial [Sideroxydans sp.]
MALLEQRRQLTWALETKATSLAQFMAQVSPISVLSLNFVEMNNNVKKVVLTDDEAVYAIIVNEQRVPLAYYFQDADELVTDKIRTLMAERNPLAAIEAMKQSGLVLEVTAPIKAGEKHIGSATVGFSLDRMHHALMLQIALIGTILIVVTGASLLVLVLALRRILQPVQALTSAATQISTGDLNVVLTGTERSDELGVLSRAFGSMATQLRGLIAGMEQRMAELQHMGQALQKSEEEFRRIVATANEGILVLDADVKATFVNARMAEMLGYPAEAMIGRSVTDFLFEEDLPDHLKEMEKRRRGQSETYERRFLRRDGQTVWALVSATPIFDGQHRYQGSFGMFTDITERKRAEEALRESEQRYRLVFENSPVSIWEEDFSGVKMLFDDLKKQGVSDIEAHFARHPETVRQCADLARIVDVNRAALTLHGAANRDELLAGLVNTFTPESFDTFRQELVCLWKGQTEMTGDAVVKTLAGAPRNVTVYYS